MLKKALSAAAYAAIAACLAASYLLCGVYQAATAPFAADSFIDTSSWTQPMLFNQILLITVLSAVGLALLLCAGERRRFFLAALAFPCGVAFAFIVSFALLLFNIPYSVPSLLAAGLLIMAAACVFLRKKLKPSPNSGGSLMMFIPLFIAVSVLAATACSMIPIKAITSDGVNFYQMNGDLIARFGRLNYFDAELTLTVGQLLPVICSWCYMFGFRQPYGIMYMLELCMLGYLFYFAAKRLGAFEDKKRLVPIAAALVLCLVLQPVYVIDSVWILANPISMVFLALCVGLAAEMAGGASAPRRFALALLCPCLLATRSESILNVLLLAGVMVSIPAISDKQLAFAIILPSSILQALLYLNTFVIHADETFGAFRGGNTPSVAVMVLLLAACAMLYVLLLRRRNALNTTRHFNAIIIAGLVAAFIIASAANAGFIVAVFNRRYELIPKTNRILYDNFYTAAVGVATILGPLIGGAIKNLLESSVALTGAMEFAGIRLLYVVSTIGILLLQIIFSRVQNNSINASAR